METQEDRPETAINPVKATECITAMQAKDRKDHKDYKDRDHSGTPFLFRFLFRRG